MADTDKCTNPKSKSTNQDNQGSNKFCFNQSKTHLSILLLQNLIGDWWVFLRQVFFLLIFSLCLLLLSGSKTKPITMAAWTSVCFSFFSLIRVCSLIPPLNLATCRHLFSNLVSSTFTSIPLFLETLLVLFKLCVVCWFIPGLLKGFGYLWLLVTFWSHNILFYHG